MPMDERCRIYCGCEKCLAYPLKQPTYNWTQTELDQCRFGQIKAIIEREIRMSKGTD